MFIPDGKTEEDVLEAIERAVNILAPSFVFGYYDLDDIKQFGRTQAIICLGKGKYDSSRPLENFLYTHIRNQYLNLQRNKLKRSDAPCKQCHAGEFCVPGGCEKYEVWRKRNCDKANLMRPVEMDESHENRLAPDLGLDIDASAMMTKIDLLLPVEFRLTWRKILDGVKVPKPKRDLVQNAVREILGMSSDKGPDECQ